MSIRTTACLSNWIYNALDKASISNLKGARLLAIPFVPYVFFVKMISPFTSIYSNIQDIRTINRQLFDTDLDDELRSDLEAEKKVRQISLIKSTVCALIFPLYALISAIKFAVQIILNPRFAARSNSPLHRAYLEEISFVERKWAKSITEYSGQDPDLLQQELQTLQRQMASFRDHLISLSIEELPLLKDPENRFNAVIQFFNFKADTRAKIRCEDLEEIFELMEKVVYSSKRELDALFECARNVIDNCTEIDSYKPDNVDENDLCRARKSFKENIMHFFEQDEIGIIPRVESAIDNLVELYLDEKELRSKLEHTSDGEALNHAVDRCQVLISEGYNYALKDIFTMNWTKPFKSN
ncbi:MAG: hypothetical protein QRY74_04285 [Chlamydia sp.]